VRFGYLGPEGSFTHAAALAWGPTEAVGYESVQQVYAAVAAGTVDRGVVAIENTVEGYVVPSLDAILAADDVVAVDETALEIAFDAFVRPGTDRAALTQVTAHPHGLAQCARFVERTALEPVPAASNAAGCRDVGPHQVALGPRVCGELYGLETFARDVEDHGGARTRFLLLARRDEATDVLARARAAAGGRSVWRTMLAVTPVVTGPGVLAQILDDFGAGGVNLSSLVTRPAKVAGKYVFVLTLDAPAWDPLVRVVLGRLLDGGSLVKTLGVFPAGGDTDEALDLDHVPAGSVSAASSPAECERGLLWR
jgi:prephenate dehydratase/chorismate mutase/prephenate dehydratase